MSPERSGAVQPTKLLRAIRGATTVERDEAGHMRDRVQELVRAVLSGNDVTTDDIVSIIFTATSDISSMFPASAARELGLNDVPLLGAQELEVDNALPRCIRMLVHVYTARTRAGISHVFLHEASSLRVDLVN